MSDHLYKDYLYDNTQLENGKWYQFKRLGSGPRSGVWSKPFEKVLGIWWTRSKVFREVEFPKSHLWTDGPDGKLYHCSFCGISKCDDYDGRTCEDWIKRKS